MIGIKPPPLWTTMNAVRDYEKAMTQTTEEMKMTNFTAGECAQLKSAKDRIEDLLPPWVREDSSIVVAGGCWASALQREAHKDIDVFILGDPSYPDIHKKKHDIIREKMKKWYESIENNTLEYARNNDKVDEVWTSKLSKVQFIFTKHQTRKELIEDFDYVHCKTSYTEGKLYTTRKIYDAIMNKQLIVQNNKNIQLWRKEKFLDRGYLEPAEKEQTIGEWLAGALKRNPVNVSVGGGGGGGGNILIQTDYIPW